MRRRGWPVPLLTAGLLACLPSAPCACTPHPFMYEITGLVTTAEGEPRDRITVEFAHVLDCVAGGAEVTLGSAVTDSRGRYAFQTPVERSSLCLRAVARAAPLIIEADSAVAGPVRLEPGANVLNLSFSPRPPWRDPSYLATLEAFGEDSVRITTVLSNPGSGPLRVLLRTPCTVTHRAWTGAGMEGPPAWNSENRPGGCKSFGLELVLEAGAEQRYSATIRADEVLRQPIPGQTAPPAGVFTFAAVVEQREPAARTIILPAGTATLK